MNARKWRWPSRLLAASKTYAQRPGSVLALVPTDDQSFWVQAKRPNGEIYTQLNLRFQVTNLSDGAIMLSSLKVVRPWTRQRAIVANMMHVQDPEKNEYSSKNPILPHSLTYASAVVIIGYAVGRIGKPMRVVVSMRDQAGTCHKLVFPHLSMMGK